MFLLVVWLLFCNSNGKVLVTGATGFFGGAIARRLKNLGLPVIGQGRDYNNYKLLKTQGLECFRWNISDPLSPEKLDNLRDVSAVVHCAGLSSPVGSKDAFQTANVTGTINVLELARKLNVKRFIYISSPSVYFTLKDQLNVSEGYDLPKPFNQYANSKVIAEKIVLKTPQVGPIVLRPRGIYGPGDRHLLPRLLKAAERRPLPKFRSGIAEIDLTYIDDAVDAVVAALRSGEIAKGRVFNISGGEVLKVSYIVESVCSFAGVPVSWQKLPFRPLLFLGGMAEAIAMLRPESPEPAITRYGLSLFAFRQSLNLELAKNVLGWTPNINFSTGINKTFKKSLHETSICQ